SRGHARGVDRCGRPLRASRFASRRFPVVCPGSIPSSSRPVAAPRTDRRGRACPRDSFGAAAAAPFTRQEMDMKRTATLMLLAAMTVAGVIARPFAQGSQVTPYRELTAFVNVNAVPMDREHVLQDWTVVVGDGKVIAMGPSSSTPVPEGATTIDGRGKYLMPGLAEMHGHLPSPESSDPEYLESILYLFVANGVTTVRGMQGAPGQLELRERAARGEIISPQLFLAGPAFSGGTVKSPEDAIARVKQQKAEGWDLLKVLPGLSLESYDAMAKTAQELF